MSQTILETEVKKISLLFWERLKLKPSEVWANTELLQQFMLLNPSEMFAIEGYKEKERGGDIEFWVVDRNSKMICLTVQGKRLFEHPSIPDRYDELNYEQLTDLLETADNEKNIPLYNFYNTPFKKGYFKSINSTDGENFGWINCYAHDIYNNYCSHYGEPPVGTTEDIGTRYKECSEIVSLPTQEPMHELVTLMIKAPRLILAKYENLRKGLKHSTRYKITNLNKKPYLKQIPSIVRSYMTSDQIESMDPFFAYIPASKLNKSRPVIIVKSSEYLT